MFRARREILRFAEPSKQELPSGAEYPEALVRNKKTRRAATSEPCFLGSPQLLTLRRVRPPQGAVSTATSSTTITFFQSRQHVRKDCREECGSKGAQRGSWASGRQAYRLNTRRAGSLQEKSPAFGGAKSEEVRVAKRQACSSHITGTTNGQATAAKTTTKSIGPP